MSEEELPCSEEPEYPDMDMNGTLPYRKTDSLRKRKKLAQLKNEVNTSNDIQRFFGQHNQSFFFNSDPIKLKCCEEMQFCETNILSDLRTR